MQPSRRSQIRDEFTRQADTKTAAAAVFTDQERLARIHDAAGLRLEKQPEDV